MRIDKAGTVWLNLRPSRGRLPKWPTGADCKSAGLRLRWFESITYHQPSPAAKRGRRLPRRSAERAGGPVQSRDCGLRLGQPATFQIATQPPSQRTACRGGERRLPHRSASAQAGRFKIVTAGCGPASRHFRLPIYDLAAGGHKLQMKSSAKDEVKKKEAGHYSGLSMRTKRLNQHLVAALLRTFCWMRRRIHTPCFTHGTLRFCIPTMRLRYQRPCPLPVTSSGYTQTRDYILDKRIKFASV